MTTPVQLGLGLRDEARPGSHARPIRKFRLRRE